MTLRSTRQPFASRLLRDTAIYGSAAVLTRATAIILLPLYTRFLEPDELGQIELLTIVATILHATVALEIAQGLARHLLEQESPAERHSVASTALLFTLTTYAVMALGGLAFAEMIAEALLGSSRAVVLIRVAVLATLLNGVLYLLLNQLRYELRPVPYGIVSILYAALAIGGAIWLVGVLRAGPVGVFAAQAAGAVAAACLAFAFAQDLGLRLTFSLSKLGSMLRFSVPLVPASVGAILALSVDRIAIGHLMTLEDVGVFGVGYRIAHAVSLIAIGFQLALTPLVYQRYRDPDTPVELSRLFRNFVGLALIVCLAIGLFGKALLAALATAPYAAAAGVITILAPAVLLAHLFIFAPGLSIAKRSATAAVLSLGGAMLNGVLAFALVPILGIIGAAWATLVGYSVAFALYMAASQRFYYVPHRWGQLGVATLAIGVLLAVGAVLAAPLPAELFVRVILLAAGIGIVTQLGLVDISQLRGAMIRMRRSPT